MRLFFTALLLLCGIQLAHSAELVRWTEEAVGFSDVDHYIVQRAGIPIAIVPSSKTYFIDNQGTIESKYSVKIVFLNSIPDQEIQVQDYTVIDGNEIPMTWQDNSDNEDGFNIERKTPDQQDFTEIASVGVDVNQFTDTDVVEGQGYIYRVNAFNAFGVSGYTNQLFTFMLLNKPTDVILSSD